MVDAVEHESHNAESVMKHHEDEVVEDEVVECLVMDENEVVEVNETKQVITEELEATDDNDEIHDYSVVEVVEVMVDEVIEDDNDELDDADILVECEVVEVQQH